VSTEYEVWLCSDRGERLWPFGGEFESLNYTRIVNGAGKLHGFSTRAEGLDLGLIRPDYQLQVWRRPPGGVSRLDLLAFIRHWKWRLDATGAVRLIVEDNQDQKELLRRRIVAYYSGHAEAFSNNDAADNIMQDILDANFLNPDDTAREMPFVSIETGGNAGPAISKGYAWQSVMELLVELSQESQQAGNEVFFDLAVHDVDYGGSQTTFQFRTFTGQPGADNTHDSPAPVIFGPAFENIEEMELVYDYRNEVNAVYVAGQGVGERRMVVLVEDEAAQAASFWNRREDFVDARDIEGTTAGEAGETIARLTTRGQQRINETKPYIGISGRVRSTEHTLYGRDWDLGHLVTVDALKVQFDALIRVVNVQVQRGREQVIGLVEARL
jgi:hypothetical protein